jgi:hypothetical protein
MMDVNKQQTHACLAPLAGNGRSPATITVTLRSQFVFKMAVSIQNPAKCEVRGVIRFLQAKGETAAEIHRHLVSVMNRQNVAKWRRELEAGRCNVHDDGHPLSLMKSSKN